MTLAKPGPRLADALLNAEATFTQAQAKHEVERTELSRRVLAGAEEKLRQAEEAAAGVKGHFELELQCRVCEWVVTPQRWRLDGGHDANAVEAGVRVVPVFGNPEAVQ